MSDGVLQGNTQCIRITAKGRREKKQEKNKFRTVLIQLITNTQASDVSWTPARQETLATQGRRKGFTL